MKMSVIPIRRIQSIRLALTIVVALIIWPLTVSGQSTENARVLNHPEVKSLPGKDKRWALIVGVNNYGLKGAANDARALKKTLVKYAGFPPEQVLLLTTDDPEQVPTRNRI